MIVELLWLKHKAWPDAMRHKRIGASHAERQSSSSWPSQHDSARLMAAASEDRRPPARRGAVTTAAIEMKAQNAIKQLQYTTREARWGVAFFAT